MLHTIFIKCKVGVMYFIFIFISPSVPRFSVKKFENQLIKNKRPKWGENSGPKVTTQPLENVTRIYIYIMWISRNYIY